jgi:hypothetical protein
MAIRNAALISATHIAGAVPLLIMHCSEFLCRICVFRGLNDPHTQPFPCCRPKAKQPDGDERQQASAGNWAGRAQGDLNFAIARLEAVDGY